MKKCSKCKKDKNEVDFCKDAKSKDKLQSVCKSCKSESVSEYYKRHPEKRRTEQERERGLKRYHENPVRSNISRMVRFGLNGFTKSKPTFDLLGYTVNELKLHLESKFLEGMTWENYGEWHIDHIVPQSKLKYESPDHPNFKICWSLNNLQPLWAVDNIKKGSK
jgi:hypothetical protein